MACILQEVLVGNYDARYESSSNSDVAQEEDANNSKHHHKQPHQRQQEGRTSGSLPALELRSFSLHPSRSHIAVGVRRQGVCAVDVYHMPEPAAAAAVADIVTAAAEAAEAAEAAAEAAPQIYTLHTKPSSSGSNGSGNTDSSNAADVTASASTAAIASAAATAGVSAARLSWVLVLDEPTLVSEVLGVMTKHDITRAAGVTHAGADSLSDSWLAISVSGITSPTTVYYVNMKDPQQQVQVSTAWLSCASAAANGLECSANRCLSHSSELLLHLSDHQACGLALVGPQGQHCGTHA
jgi:hypothetical protein